MTSFFRRLRSLVTLFTPLRVTPIACRSSWKVERQVFCGLTCLRLSETGSQFKATLVTCRSFYWQASIRPASFNLLTLTISDIDRSCSFAPLRTSSMVTWSLHEIPMIVWIHLWWNTSSLWRMLVYSSMSQRHVALLQLQ